MTWLSAVRRAVSGAFKSSAKAAYGLLDGIFLGGGEPPARGTREYLELYNRSPWIRAVFSKLAWVVASTRWTLHGVRRDGKYVADRSLQRAWAHDRDDALRLSRAKGELVDLSDHVLLAALADPNPVLTGLEVEKLMMLDLLLVGDSFWVKERNGIGAPVRFWPIPPDWVRETPSPSRPFFRVGFRGWQGEIPETEILWHRDPNPSNPYGRGSGTAQAVGDEAETAEYAAKFIKTRFYNGARPDFIVEMDGGSEPERQRLEQHWRQRMQGFWRAFQPYFVNRKLQVHQLNQVTFEHLQMVPLMKHERDVMVQIVGMPPELLGILESSNKATISAAEYLLTRWVAVPWLELIRATRQARLVPEYDRRLVLSYVSPVQEDREQRLAAMKAAPWAWELDEWRGLLGDPAVGGAVGRSRMVPLNMYATTDLLDLAQRPKPGLVAAASTEDTPPKA